MRGFFSKVGVSLSDWVLSLVVVMTGISLGDEMSIDHLFSMFNWLVTGGGVLVFPVGWVR